MDIKDPIMWLWGWFIRFDPAADFHLVARNVSGNRMILELPILIDVCWKKGYPHPVAFDPSIAKRVNDLWSSYGISVD